MQLLELRLIDIYLFLTLLAVVTILLVISFFRGSQKNENYFLVGIIGLFLIHMGLVAGSHSDWISDILAQRVGYVFNLSYGPLFLLYFQKALTAKRLAWSWLTGWFVLGALLPEFKLGFVLYISLMIASLAINLVAVVALFKKSKKASPPGAWHYFLLSFFILFTLTYIYELVFAPLTPEFSWQMRFAYFSELMVLAGGFLFFSVRHPQYFLNVKVIHTRNVLKPEEDPSAATEVKMLVHQVVDQSLYKDPELSRAHLSETTGIGVNRISQLVNQTFNLNFSDWINSYRIRESKELLITEMELSIKEIYYRVGFNSKSAFYNAFKKQTGLTPTAYRQEHKHRQAA